MKTTFVNLQGGLGNQLFIYFYSLYFSQNHQKKIIFLRSGKNVLSKVGIDVEKETFSINESFRNALFRLLSKLSKFTFFSRYVYVSEDIGFDQSLKNLDQVVFISGYFQTPIYINKLDKFLERIEEIKDFLGETRSIEPRLEFRESAAIHIRRGDYLLSKNSYFGLLSSDYYIDAISSLVKSKNVAKIFLFSDSELKPSFILELKNSFPKINFLDMSCEKLNDVETFHLLTLFDSIVISNSTFAWWGAFLKGNSEVFCPEDWFKERPSPNMIYPEHWITIRSRWV